MARTISGITGTVVGSASDLASLSAAAIVASGTTISGSYAYTVTLTRQADSPVSVTGTVSVADGTALTALGNGGAYTWAVDNSGTLSGGGTGHLGIQLGSATGPVYFGTVSNHSGGRITGGDRALGIYGPGLVNNLSGGYIAGTGESGVYIAKTGTVTNSGAVSGGKYGVYLHSDGTVTNLAGGNIGGLSARAVNINGDATRAATDGQPNVQVYNAGTLSGVAFGVFELRGGSITNAALGTVTGTFGPGILLRGPGTVVNSGLVSSAISYAIYLYGSGSVTNSADGVLSGGVYVGYFPGVRWHIHQRRHSDREWHKYRRCSVWFPRVRSGLSPDRRTGRGVHRCRRWRRRGHGTRVRKRHGNAVRLWHLDHQLQHLAVRSGRALGDSGRHGSAIETITGFVNGNTIDLTDFQATSASFANNTLTLTDVGGGQQTLAIYGSFDTNSFHVSPLGTAGSSIVVGRTISGSYNTGIYLSSESDNPVLVTGTIAPASGTGLTGKGGAGNSWTVDNAGEISANSGGAVVLGPPGSSIASGMFVNEPGAAIYSPDYGVYINGPGSITNMAGGTIVGKTFSGMYILGGPGTIVNAGKVSAGSVAAFEKDGGSITNLSGGILAGSGGVVFDDAPGTLTNAGTVIGNDTNANPLWRNAAPSATHPRATG